MLHYHTFLKFHCFFRCFRKFYFLNFRFLSRMPPFAPRGSVFFRRFRPPPFRVFAAPRRGFRVLSPCGRAAFYSPRRPSRGRWLPAFFRVLPPAFCPFLRWRRRRFPSRRRRILPCRILPSGAVWLPPRACAPRSFYLLSLFSAALPKNSRVCTFFPLLT